MYWVVAIAALGFLIVVHEAGHYFVARWCGMRVERFSLGFGPGILKKKAKNGTIFQIAPIPFGGFVEIRGMNIAEDVDPDDHQAYPNRPAWQRFVTIFAGPATNYLSAIVLAFCLFTCTGVDGDRQYFGVGHVLVGYDAHGKLERGDRILAVDGEPILAAVGDSLTERVSKRKGAPMTLTVKRGGAELQISVTPKPKLEEADETDVIRDIAQATELLAKHQRGRVSDYTTVLGRGKQSVDKEGRPEFLLGIRPTIQVDKVQVGVLGAIGHALQYPIDKTKDIGANLYGIITGKEKADPGGPKRIVDEFEKAFSYSFETGISLLMLLSVYLGLFNLFPLPALDGGRLVFLGYELVTRRRANPKIESMVHLGGIMVLFVVMILVTLHDFHVF